MYGMGEPVQINNEVDMPVAEPDNEGAGDTRTPEEKRLMKELRKKEEELKTMEAEHRYEMENRINEEAEAKLKQFLVRRSESLEKERTEIIEAAKREAASLTADAKATTMSVIKKAETESIKLREEARREGHEQGYAEGRTESLEKYTKYIDAAGKLLGEINSRKEAYYISNEEEMRETIFEMVQKVIGVALKADPQIIDGIIGEAAKNFRNSDYIKITLADDEISERYITDKKLMRDIIPYIPEIEIEFDDEADEGTVIIDDGSEIVDAGIPTQLDFLKEILRNTRGENTEDEEEFMEEIKGRAHRRKSVTIGAGAETAEEIQPRVPGAADEAVETVAEMAVEAVIETAMGAGAAAAAAGMETAAAEAVKTGAAAETAAAVEEPKPKPKPKTGGRKKKAAEQKSEPMFDMSVVAADELAEVEPAVESSPILDMNVVAADELAAADELTEAMAFVEAAAAELPDEPTPAEIAAAAETEGAATEGAGTLGETGAGTEEQLELDT